MQDYIANFERVLAERGEWQGNRVHFRCPFPGCVTYSKKKLSVEPQRGFWRCLHCRHIVPGKEYHAERSDQDGGTALEFARLMGDDLALWPRGTMGVGAPELPVLTPPQARKVWNELFAACSLTPEDADLMEARGIDAHQAGFVSVSDPAVTHLTAVHGAERLSQVGLLYPVEHGEFRRRTCIKEGRILIPYREEKKGQITHFVGYSRLAPRFPSQTDAEYDAVQSNWPKCAGPAGFTAPVYGVIPPGAPYVIVTEGQIKAIAALQRGFPCVGLQGMSSSHAVLTRLVLKAGAERVILLFDSDAKDQENIEYEELRLARLLLKAGVPCYQGRLPLADGELKMDLDDFLLKASATGLLPVLLQAARRPFLALPAISEVPRVEESEPD